MFRLWVLTNDQNDSDFGSAPMTNDFYFDSGSKPMTKMSLTPTPTTIKINDSVTYGTTLNSGSTALIYIRVYTPIDIQVVV